MLMLLLWTMYGSCCIWLLYVREHFMLSSTRVLKGPCLRRAFSNIVYRIVLECLDIWKSSRASIRLSVRHVSVHHTPRRLLVWHGTWCPEPFHRSAEILHSIWSWNNAVISSSTWRGFDRLEDTRFYLFLRARVSLFYWEITLTFLNNGWELVRALRATLKSFLHA